MKIAILESIVMPAGHEVEFDRECLVVSVWRTKERISGGC